MKLLTLIAILLNMGLVWSASLLEKVNSALKAEKYLLVVELTEGNIASKMQVAYARGAALFNLELYSEALPLLEQVKKSSTAPPKDLHFILAQIYFIKGELRRARSAFKESVRAEYKLGESLYYMGFISQKLGNQKSAVRIYKKIETLPEDLKQEVIQAARFQVAQIFLRSAEKASGPAAAVERHVIPQMKTALAWDEDSQLGEVIRKEIRRVQEKYDLAFYSMANGKAVADPPYYLRGSLVSGFNDNVTQRPLETNTSEDATGFVGANMFGRYTFYPNKRFSFAPQLALNYLDYLSDESGISALESFSYTYGIFSSFEHKLFNKVASTYLTITQGEVSRDLSNKKDYLYTDELIRVELAEEFRYFDLGSSVVRLAFLQSDSDDVTFIFDRYSAIWEQSLNFKNFSHFFYIGYDVLSFTDESLNRSSISLRWDLLFFSWVKDFTFAPYGFASQASYQEGDQNTQVLGFGMNTTYKVNPQVYLNLGLGREDQFGDEDTDYESHELSFSLDYIY